MNLKEERERNFHQHNKRKDKKQCRKVLPSDQKPSKKNNKKQKKRINKKEQKKEKMIKKKKYQNE